MKQHEAPTTMDVMDHVRQKQRQIALRRVKPPELHSPEMLYIGCVDARLDPIEDIGIPKGKALIFRNIAALVTKHKGGKKFDEKLALETGEIPADASVGAVLEFFVNHLPAEEGKVRHIVVSGHTDCGGLKACRQGHAGPDDEYLPEYLERLSGVRAHVMEKAEAEGWDKDRILTELEQESVRSSIANLMEYPAVKRAIENGTLVVHGWVLDTGTYRISEMDPETKQFKPMETEVGTHAERSTATGNSGHGGGHTCC